MTTLHRTLEPEVMDTLEEAREYDAMDHSAVNKVFVTDLLATTVDFAGDVLDLGCGTAQIPVELCERCEKCRVMAIDLSVHMLDLANYNVEVAGLIERIMLDRVDAKQLPYEDGRFFAVISNSIVHHIPEPGIVLSEAVRVLASDGRIFVRDLMRPADEATLEKLVQQYAGGETSHARQMFADSLRAALTLDEIRALAAGFGFDPETVQATSDRHWSWNAANI